MNGTLLSVQAKEKRWYNNDKNNDNDDISDDNNNGNNNSNNDNDDKNDTNNSSSNDNKSPIQPGDFSTGSTTETQSIT